MNMSCIKWSEKGHIARVAKPRRGKSYSEVWPPNSRKAYSRPQTTINGLQTDFLWRRGVELLESGLISWNDCFCDADTETLKLNEKLCFSTLAVFLCRSNLGVIFLIDSSLAVFWEERSENKANFPLKLNNFFTSCARWHKNSNWANILTFDFYPKHFHESSRNGTIFDLNRFTFYILTAKNSPTLHAVLLYYLCAIDLVHSWWLCKNAHRGSTVGFLLLQCSCGVVRNPSISRCRSQYVVSVESSSCLIIISICDLFVSRDDQLMS